MKKIIIAVATTGLLLLTACGASATPGVTGVVTEKEYKPKAGKGQPACYELEITDINGVETDFCVSWKLFHRYNVGDKYPK